MSVAGIDLGTSTSAIAVYNRGRVEILPVEGRSVMPSCVAAKPGGGLLVGELAKKRAVIDPENTVLAIKREMGNRDYRAALDGVEYSPVEISSMILRKLADAAGEHLGTPLSDVVISVPAYFTNNQKEDTRLAGAKAGLKVLRLIPEPTAAAIAYGLNKGRDQTILVYDLGGGTFDVSILRVHGNQFDVIGIGGDHNLGGEDFDRCMIDLVIAELRQSQRAGRQLDDSDTARLYVRLKETAEAAKKELSHAEAAEIEIADVGELGLMCLRVTRPQYEAAIADLVDRTLSLTLQTLKEVSLTADDVDRVVMVGGSTRIPLIQRKLAEAVCEPYVAEHVDEIVSHGAAIMAANLSAVSVDAAPAEAPAKSDLAPIEVTNITAHSLGIRGAGDRFSVLIPRGTRLPTVAEKTFTTVRDNADRTDVIVFQGEAEDCSHNEQIGGFGLTGIDRAPAGKPKIDVHFTLDADDILTVSAEDRSTGRGGNIRIEQFEPKPYEPQEERSAKDLTSLRIAVSARGCDDAGQVIAAMGFRHKVLKHEDFRQIKQLARFDLVFINCLADLTQVLGTGIFLSATKNARALNEFVEKGGILYVSDYALDNITQPFPGHIKFRSKGEGKAGKATATVVDPNLRELVGPMCPINFNTIYAPVDSVSDDCHVYLAKGTEPLLVSFQHGAGHVVYTSFHNGVQVSEKERTLLTFIILQTISLATSTPLIELAEAANLLQ